ncbi:MAG: PAS domain S-box protein [Dehalococcoidia bacterium]|nr:PAS domain S-box protein [Dehalococcoidia bacterium]
MTNADAPSAPSPAPDPADLPALLLQQAPDAVVFADTQGRVQSWNPAAEALFGYTADEAMGQSLDIIVPERFRDAHWTGFDRALAAGDTKYRGQSLPTRAQRKDGEQIYVELSFAIVHDTGGEVVGASAHARNINERFIEERDRRRRLAAVEHRLSELGETLPE